MSTSDADAGDVAAYPAILATENLDLFVHGRTTEPLSNVASAFPNRHVSTTVDASVWCRASCRMMHVGAPDQRGDQGLSGRAVPSWYRLRSTGSSMTASRSRTRRSLTTNGSDMWRGWSAMPSAWNFDGDHLPLSPVRELGRLQWVPPRPNAAIDPATGKPQRPVPRQTRAETSAERVCAQFTTAIRALKRPLPNTVRFCVISVSSTALASRVLRPSALVADR